MHILDGDIHSPVLGMRQRLELVESRVLLYQRLNRWRELVLVLLDEAIDRIGDLASKVMDNKAAGHLWLAVDLIRGRFVEFAMQVLEQRRVIGGRALLALIIDQRENAARLLGD